MSLLDAVTLFQNGQTKESLSILESLPEAKRELSDSQTMIALCLAAERKFERAQAIFRALTRREPNEPAHWSNLAATQSDLGDFDGAIDNYKAALQRGSDGFSLLRPLGELLLRKNDVQGALGCLIRALELEPSSIDTRVFLADAFSQIGEHTEAIRLVSDWRDSIIDDVDLLLLVATINLRGRHSLEAHYISIKLKSIAPSHSGTLELASVIKAIK